ncbi:MAG: hypothetical protein NTZ68_00090 [Candidatus Dependentiae bacterium]|nr:hypothetical protein [Candidatus Dependentiae bacterium]
MKIKSVTVILSCLLMATFAQAKDKGTVATRFSVEPSVLKNHVKTFVNSTGKSMAVRYMIKDHDSGKFYKQEPILKDGESLVVDFFKAAAYAEGWKTPSKNHEFSLEVLRVLQSPNRLTENVVSGLKKGRMKSEKHALLMGKSEFLKSDRIEFFKDKKGYVRCELSCRPRKES